MPTTATTPNTTITVIKTPTKPPPDNPVLLPTMELIYINNLFTMKLVKSEFQVQKNQNEVKSEDYNEIIAYLPTLKIQEGSTLFFETKIKSPFWDMSHCQVKILIFENPFSYLSVVCVALSLVFCIFI